MFSQFFFNHSIWFIAKNIFPDRWLSATPAEFKIHLDTGTCRNSEDFCVKRHTIFFVFILRIIYVFTLILDKAINNKK